MPEIYDELRKAIDSSRKTRYRISKETGISESHLAQFMKGNLGLSVESIEKILDSLGLSFRLIRSASSKDRAGSRKRTE